jgi:hypothetical protein
VYQSLISASYIILKYWHFCLLSHICFSHFQRWQKYYILASRASTNRVWINLLIYIEVIISNTLATRLTWRTAYFSKDSGWKNARSKFMITNLVRSLMMKLRPRISPKPAPFTVRLQLEAVKSLAAQVYHIKLLTCFNLCPKPWSPSLPTSAAPHSSNVSYVSARAYET